MLRGASILCDRYRATQLEMPVDCGQKFVVFDVPDRLVGGTTRGDGQVRDHLAKPPIRVYLAQLADESKISCLNVFFMASCP